MDSQYAQYLLNKVKDDYNLIAEEFSRTRQQIWPEAKRLFDYIRPNDRVLDLGCGNGRCLGIIKEMGGQYWGTDNAEKLIQIAQQKYPAEQFIVADALKQPFADNFFDIVYSIAVLHHIPSKGLREKFMLETKRVLKPGGFFILTVWKPKDKQERRVFWRFLLKKILGLSKLDWGDILEPWGDKAERYYHCFSLKELRELAQRAGWQIIESGLIRTERGNRNNFYLVVKKPNMI